MKTWTRPEFEELTMNAEIGAYQPDDDDREPPPVIAPGAVIAEAGAVPALTTPHD